MGVSERKERDKIKLRDKIISAAATLFLKNGVEGASIRMIADKIEYSPATIYLHFKDKNELFYEIMQQAFTKYFKHFSKVNQIENPMERLKEFSKVYITYAIENPSYYDLMFILRAPMQTKFTYKSWEHGEESHNVLADVVKECITLGYFKGHDPEALALTIWSTLHGLVSLKLRDRLCMYDEEYLEKLIQNSLQSLNTLLEKS